MYTTFPYLKIGALGDRVPMFGNSDIGGWFGLYNEAYVHAPRVYQGYIVKYNPNTHTASVNISGANSLWYCFFADEPLSFAFGYSATLPAMEGEMVLVYQLVSGADAGVIIGRIPYALTFGPKVGDVYNDPDEYHRRLFTQNVESSDLYIPGMLKPLMDDNDNSTKIKTHFRPTDVYPGEFAHVNQHNCGIKGGMFSATLLGGGASLRLSALSNLARITAESYQRYTLYGAVHEFHNGRYLSSERNVSMYQEERLGWHSPERNDDFRSNVWEFDSERPVGGENQTMRPRIKDLSGYFGHLISKFCLRPDPNDNSVRVQGESSPKEAGVSRITIDPSGQYRLSAAGMIAIERTGRIPVPVRRCYPTDNGHQIKNIDGDKPEVLAPFIHDDSDPCNRQLELYDRQAYDLKTQYSRVDGTGTSDPDYDVPQEEDLDPLDDSYDPKFFGNSTVELKKYDKRRAGVYIGEDGSVIIRDAWGSEIVMAGGNISMACAGNVMTLPGQTSLTIAGDDIIQKAQNSIDIHASEHDVRLSAARNMEILGGGDEKEYSGGVVIESRGSDTSKWNGRGEGEEARLSGITLRTSNQAVVIDGKKLNLRSREDTRILSGGKDLAGSISIAAKSIRTRAMKNVMSSDEGDAHIIVNRKSVQAAAGSIGIFSEKNLTLVKGDKSPVPMKWADVENIAEDLIPELDEYTDDLSDDKTASAGFDRDALDDMIFGFRKSSECRTDQSWSIGASDSHFKLFEPAWIQVMKKFETLRSNGVDAKPFVDNPEWENGLPFPGLEAVDSATYAKLDGMEPENISDDGINKRRNKVKDRDVIVQEPLCGGYLVRKQ